MTRGGELESEGRDLASRGATLPRALGGSPGGRSLKIVLKRLQYSQPNQKQD